MGGNQEKNNASNEFRETLAEFRGAMQQAGAQTQNPGLETILERGRSSNTALQLRWGLAAALLVTFVIAPVYQYQREAERVQLEHQRQAQEDALLLQQINDSLSRQVPRAMAALMGGN
jgi:hypothetical protein